MQTITYTGQMRTNYGYPLTLPVHDERRVFHPTPQAAYDEMIVPSALAHDPIAVGAWLSMVPDMVVQVWARIPPSDANSPVQWALMHHDEDGPDGWRMDQLRGDPDRE